MRHFTAGLLVAVLVLGGILSAVGVLAQPALSDYLPRSLYLPHESCFRIDGEGTLDFATILERFPSVPDAPAQLEVLGWQEGAYRQFGCDVPPVGMAGWIEISVHRFGHAASARAAVPFFAYSRAIGTNLQPVPAFDPNIGTAALTGPASNGTEYTLYRSFGPLLYRVTGVAPVGSPARDVEQVMTVQIAVTIIVDRRNDERTAAPAPPPTVAYSVTDLGTGGGNSSSASRINESGQVLWTWGTTQDPMSGMYVDARSGIWQDGSIIDLTSLGMGFSRAINDLGAVLGSAGGDYLLYLPDSGRVQALPSLGPNTFLHGFNNAGAMTGTVNGRPVVVEDGQLTEIPMPVGYGLLWPGAISNAGDVAATVAIGPSDPAQRAALYADGIVFVLGPAPGATGSSAADVNEAGQLVGSPERLGARWLVQGGRAFLYDHATGGTTDLGTLPGYANSTPTAINNAGQVVGAVWLPQDQGDPFRRAFVYDHRFGLMTDLNALIDPASGWFLVDAYDINDAGQIVGRGLIDGEMHAFLLTPVG